ncbi:MAG: glycosyltransferase family 4 protein, partial [Acidimicrobiia bacterium]
MRRSKIRILEVCGYPPPHNGWNVRIVHLKRQLDAEGHECVVLNTGESRRIPSPHYDTVENGFVFLRKVWRYSRRGFLIHAHANGEAPKGIVLAILAELLARCVGVGSVLTFHAGTDQVFFPRQKAPAWVPVFRLLFWLPHSIICNSDAVRQKILEYGVPPSKVVPIPAFSQQYVDVTPVEVPPAVERHFEKYPRMLFCYLALRPVYHPNSVLHAFAELAAADHSVGLIFCGLTSHADGPVAEAFEKAVKDLGIEHRVCRLGDLTHDQFLTIMKRSRAYVRTHVSDGVCSSVLEALTLGIPVVACDNGTRPPGVVTFPPNEPAALARAIRL